MNLELFTLGSEHRFISLDGKEKGGRGERNYLPQWQNILGIILGKIYTG